MSADRTSDLAILLGHAMQCEACRDKLLAEPDRVLIGRKVTSHQREKLLSLTAEDFENSEALAAALDLNRMELIEGSNHPRARLRHF